MSTQSPDQETQPEPSTPTPAAHDDNGFPLHDPTAGTVARIEAALDRIASALERQADGIEAQLQQGEAMSGSMASLGKLMSGPPRGA